MIIVSGAQMRQLDQEIIRRGVRPEALMELVGVAVARAVIDLWESESRCSAHEGRRTDLGSATSSCPSCCHVVAGKGHNGADGYVTARHLIASGWEVVVWTAVEKEQMSALCLQQQCAYLALGGRMAGDDDDLGCADVIVDALLGTGTRLPVDGPLRWWLQAIRRANKPVVAIDIPSGLDADHGQVDAEAVRADITVTCGVAKQGLYTYPGRTYAGRIEMATLGITTAMLAQAECQTQLVSGETAHRWWQPRRSDGHKGTFGRAGVCAGSRGMYGAARLALAGAMRGGAGLVEYLAPPSVLDHLSAALSPEILTRAVEQHIESDLSAEAVAAYARALDNCKVGLLGPGLGMEWVTLAETKSDAFAVLASSDVVQVYDATALTAIAALPDRGAGFWQARQGASVITPHPKEFSRLTGQTVAYIQSHRIDLAKAYAQTHRIVVVLKGAGTIVAAPDGRVTVNDSGNSGLATGGTGDVLAGLVTGVIASGYEPFAGAVIAVYAHGRAADIACQGRASEESLVAADLLDYIGQVWNELRKKSSTNYPGN